jgi:hypothetical protein
VKPYTGKVSLRDVIARAYPPHELEKILKRLKPDAAARLLAALEPRIKEEQGKSVYTLLIIGMGTKGDTCPRCFWKVGDEITAEEVEIFKPWWDAMIARECDAQDAAAGRDYPDESEVGDDETEVS